MKDTWREGFSFHSYTKAEVRWISHMFAVITCRSICRHTTCGPIINVERYVTCALIIWSPWRNIQDTPSVGQWYVALAKNCVGNTFTVVCVCVCARARARVCVCVWRDRCMCVRDENVTHLFRHVCVRCPVPKLRRPSSSAKLRDELR